MAPSSRRSLRTALVRLNALTLALVAGTLTGAGVFLVTMALVLKGGSDVGSTLGLLSHYLPGFTVSVGGAFLGLLWGVVIGSALAYGPAWIFYRGVLGVVERLGLEAREEDLLRTDVSVHLPSFAAAFGLFCAQAVLLATLWLIVKHEPDEPLGPHLALLEYYMPGYSVSVPGALVGFAWALAEGFTAFLLVGWIYNRIVGTPSLRLTRRDGPPIEAGSRR